MCSDEDTLIEDVKVENESGVMGEETKVHDLLTSRVPLFLSLNGIRYQFDTQDTIPAENRINVTEDTTFRSHA